MRTDPFLGRPAMHTGIDFRGDTGEPVHATAAGKVTIAGWNGGYGKMVEIDHGNGLATRYGHLSEIDVKVGQIVRIGQVIGKIGSTGRSTGPHLHYETRIDGEAVDPQKFLRAGCGSAARCRAELSLDSRSDSRMSGPDVLLHVLDLSGPPPNAFCASAACMNGSRSPSSTPPVSEVDTPVRRSFTI